MGLISLKDPQSLDSPPDLSRAEESPSVSPIPNDDLSGLPTQLWSLDKIEFWKKAVFSVLEIVSGFTCDALTRLLNEIHIKNAKAFRKIYDQKERHRIHGPGTGLLTAGNHIHLLDDPIIVAAFLNFRYLKALKIVLGKGDGFRDWHWMPAAKENFFHHKNPIIRRLFRAFFGLTKTVPITRGSNGDDTNFKPLEQQAFMRLIELLQRGDWINIFPEGTRAKEHGKLGEFKIGVGKMAIKAPNAIFSPFGHVGIKEVSPRGVKMKVKDPHTGEVLNNIIRTGQRIQVVFGEPIVLRDLVRGIPDDKDGYKEVAKLLQAKVEECFQEAIRLNQQAINSS